MAQTLDAQAGRANWRHVMVVREMVWAGRRWQRRASHQTIAERHEQEFDEMKIGRLCLGQTSVVNGDFQSNPHRP